MDLPRKSEQHRVCRRFLLLNGMEQLRQNNEPKDSALSRKRLGSQVTIGGSRAEAKLGKAIQLA